MGPVFLWYKEITHVQTVHVHVHQLLLANDAKVLIQGWG